MGMKYCGAYLMAVLGGNDSPSVADLKKILESVGAEFDDTIAEMLISELKERPCMRSLQQARKSWWALEVEVEVVLQSAAILRPAVHLQPPTMQPRRRQPSRR